MNEKFRNRRHFQPISPFTSFRRFGHIFNSNLHTKISKLLDKFEGNTHIFTRSGYAGEQPDKLANRRLDRRTELG